MNDQTNRATNDQANHTDQVNHTIDNQINRAMSNQTSSFQERRIPLHHSYIWLSALRALPYVFVGVLFSALSILSEIADYVAKLLGIENLAFLLVFAFCIVLTLVIGGFAVGAAALEYRYKWYEFGSAEFSFYSGIFSKKRTHIPYQRVQSVNEKMSLLQRIVGVCTVTIDTAGGADNKALVVPYVEKSAAERIRRELFMRKNLIASGLSPQEAEKRMESLSAQTYAPSPSMPVMPGAVQPVISGTVQPVMSGTVQETTPGDNILDMPAQVMDDMRGIFAGAEVDTGKITCEFGLSNKELVFSALSSKTSFVFVLLGVISAVSTFLGGLVDAHLVSSSEVVYSTAWHLVGSPAGVMLLFFVLSILLVFWLISVVSSCLAYAGFRSRRRGERIEVERGLITHVFSGMDVEKIQSIHIHQTFFQRLLKCCSVAYGRVGATEEESGSNSSGASATNKLVVHPFLPLSRVPEVISGLTPEYQSLPLATRTVAPCALRRALTRRVIWQGLGFWLLILLVCAWLMVELVVPEALSDEIVAGMSLEGGMVLASGVLGALIVVIAALEAINAVLWYRKAAFGWDHSGFTIVNGGFSIDTVTVPRTKIQAASLRTNPLQRHARVATVLVDTAAGVGLTRHKLLDVSRSDADAWFEWVHPRGR